MIFLYRTNCSEHTLIFIISVFFFVYQACKNGLVQHLEHLLFYGAEINARTASGNTALHVAALNNQVGWYHNSNSYKKVIVCVNLNVPHEQHGNQTCLDPPSLELTSPTCRLYAMQQRQGLVLVCVVASFLHSCVMFSFTMKLEVRCLAVQASSYCFETLWLHQNLCFFLLPKVWCSFLASVHYYERNSKTGHGKTKLTRTCFTRQYFFSCLFSFLLVFISTISFQLALLFRSALGLKFACNFTNKHEPVQLPC